MYYHKPDKIYNDDGQVNLLSNPGINFILYGMRKMANRGWQVADILTNPIVDECFYINPF